MHALNDNNNLKSTHDSDFNRLLETRAETWREKNHAICKKLLVSFNLTHRRTTATQEDFFHVAGTIIHQELDQPLKSGPATVQNTKVNRVAQYFMTQVKSRY